ncbi:MAG: PqqD family protein [Oscillospiraceae bacterium]|nr:PqqD family protein [Oscillospiraceae bacterium]
MKLHPDFTLQTIDGVLFLVPVGGEAFSGIVRSNETAAFIVELLREETTKDAIVDAMCRKYAAPRDEIAADTEAVLQTLRSIHALVE